MDASIGFAGRPSAQDSGIPHLHVLSVSVQDSAHFARTLGQRTVPALGQICEGATPSMAGAKSVHDVEDVVTYSGLCCTWAI